MFEDYFKIKYLINFFIIILFIFFISLSIIGEFNDAENYDDIPHVSKYLKNHNDCEIYGCYFYNRVIWRLVMISSIISSIGIIYFLYMLNYKVSLSLFVLIWLIIFLTGYATDNFSNYHVLKDTCDKSKSKKVIYENIKYEK